MAYFSTWRPHGNRVLETQFTTFAYLKLEPRNSENIEKNPKKKRKRKTEREDQDPARDPSRAQAARRCVLPGHGLGLALACTRPGLRARPRPGTVGDLGRVARGLGRALTCARPRSRARPRPRTVRNPCSFRSDLNLNLSLSLLFFGCSESFERVTQAAPKQHATHALSDQIWISISLSLLFFGCSESFEWNLYKRLWLKFFFYFYFCKSSLRDSISK